jgi:RecJ-like exonuclease
MMVSGTFTDEWKSVDSDVPCRKCKVAGQIERRSWESSCGGFDDDQYRCKACGGTWWIEGPDA